MEMTLHAHRLQWLEFWSSELEFWTSDIFLKIAQSELGACDLLDFVYFLFHKHLALYHTATVPLGP